VLVLSSSVPLRVTAGCHWVQQYIMIADRLAEPGLRTMKLSVPAALGRCHGHCNLRNNASALQQRLHTLGKACKLVNSAYRNCVIARVIECLTSS
jgi:hypothetical protein